MLKFGGEWCRGYGLVYVYEGKEGREIRGGLWVEVMD